jgi:hypothetical protein
MPIFLYMIIINMIHNVLSFTEISDIVNHPIVKTHNAHLSDDQKVVKFSFPLSDDMRNKLSNRLSMRLSPTVPMRWIKGDTPLHTDKGEKQFSKTHLIYLTNSVGKLIIDGQTHPIAAGDAHVFSEGLVHGTVNTGNMARLMMGPMSETGFGVGFVPAIKYHSSKSNAETDIDPTFGLGYTLETVDNISTWIIHKNEGGTGPTPNGGPYNAGTMLVDTGVYVVYPYTPPQAPTPIPRPPVWGSLFTNNAQVYYQSHTLSTGSGGSGVRNCRHKSRKT